MREKKERKKERKKRITKPTRSTIYEQSSISIFKFLNFTKPPHIFILFLFFFFNCTFMLYFTFLRVLYFKLLIFNYFRLFCSGIRCRPRERQRSQLFIGQSCRQFNLNLFVIDFLITADLTPNSFMHHADHFLHSMTEEFPSFFPTSN
jgi:hypothetical protein